MEQLVDDKQKEEQQKPAGATNSLEIALSNAIHDRAHISTCISNIITHAFQNPDNHKSAGLILSKYFDNLQKSNEQIIKIASIYKKTVGEGDEGEVNDENGSTSIEKFYEKMEKLERSEQG